MQPKRLFNIFCLDTRAATQDVREQCTGTGQSASGPNGCDSPKVSALLRPQTAALHRPGPPGPSATVPGPAPSRRRGERRPRPRLPPRRPGPRCGQLAQSRSRAPARTPPSTHHAEPATALAPPLGAARVAGSRGHVGLPRRSSRSRNMAERPSMVAGPPERRNCCFLLPPLGRFRVAPSLCGGRAAYPTQDFIVSTNADHLVTLKRYFRRT